MGPPSWVSQPTLCSCTLPNNQTSPISQDLTQDVTDSLDDVDEYVRGLAMSSLQHFNTPPEAVIASIAVTNLQAVT